MQTEPILNTDQEKENNQDTNPKSIFDDFIKQIGRVFHPFVEHMLKN